MTIQESGTSILKNELENSEDGAGQVGFQLSNDGTNEIQYGKSNYYSFQHPHEGSNQIPLFIRPRTYGNNVSSGQIMSRVKIVVVYGQPPILHFNFGELPGLTRRWTKKRRIIRIADSLYRRVLNHPLSKK